jgi:hypothetical protein
LKTLKLKLTDEQAESIAEAVAIRKSGLFARAPIPADAEDVRAAAIAAICREWAKDLTAGITSGLS